MKYTIIDIIIFLIVIGCTTTFLIAVDATLGERLIGIAVAVAFLKLVALYRG